MKDNRLSLQVVELDAYGFGIARPEAGPEDPEIPREIRVMGLLPDECAEVVIEHQSPHTGVAWAQVVRAMGPVSESRVTPRCPAFGQCGGCVWQHLAYEEQLVWKRRRVAQALAVPMSQIAPVTPSPAQWGYRNKAKYVVRGDGAGIVLGAYAPRTHQVVDTAGCAVVAPVIDEVAAWVRGAAMSAGLVPYLEREASGELRYVIVRANAGDEVLVTLVVTSATVQEKLAAVASSVVRHPAVRGVIALYNDRTDASIAPADARQDVLAGVGSLRDSIGGVAVEVGASEFFQINRAQADAMYRHVAQALIGAVRGDGDGDGDGSRGGDAGGGDVDVIDLYAGLGGFSFAAAQQGLRVHAVEVHAGAVAALHVAAKEHVLPIVAQAAGVDDILVALPSNARAMVVNPPRKGLTPALSSWILQSRIAHVVYVSCGPESLGRDIAALAQAFTVTSVIPFDLMPGTSQVETIVTLKRRA